MNSAQIGRPAGVPMLDASLCNVVGSPMSPPDGQWADLHPGMQGSVNSRPLPKPAAQPSADEGRGSPADEAIMRANQALSSRVCLVRMHAYDAMCQCHDLSLARPSSRMSLSSHGAFKSTH